MAHQKKNKNVSHSKYDHVDEMSYFELQKAFNTLHHEAKEAFKCLASNKKFFSYLEKKVSDSEKELETLKESMIKSLKGKSENDDSFWFKWAGCETCHIWQREARTLKAKLDKALQPKVTFAIDRSNFRNSMNNPYQKYTYEIRDQSSKSNSHIISTCLYCCKEGHTIKKCRFRRSLVPKGIFKWSPKSNLCFTHTQGPNKNWVPISLV